MHALTRPILTPLRSRYLLLALICLSLGSVLLWFHPYPLVLGPICLAAVYGSARWPGSWAVFVPALLPALGWAKWTGWMLFDEIDVLLLCAAAGTWARIAWPHAAAEFTPQPQWRLSPSTLALLLAWLGSSGLAAYIGVQAFGGWQWDLFGGYQHPVNSLRLLKPLLLALLLVLLWRSEADVVRAGLPRKLAWGMSLGLLWASLSGVFERWQFTGLSNFSSDYRTTGPFWEMHVGGAALDAWLALCAPFALYLLVTERQTRLWLGVVGLLGVTAYACLTTFSRGVYLAVPLAGMVTALLLWRQMRGLGLRIPLTRRDLIFAVLVFAVFLLGSLMLFPRGGYRALLALLGVMALLLPWLGLLHGVRQAHVLPAFVAGLALGGLTVVVSLQVHKGPYLAYAGVFLLTLGALFQAVRNDGAARSRATAMAMTGLLVLLMMVPTVTVHWSSAEALPAALPVPLLLFLAMVVAAFSSAQGARLPWSRDWRLHLGTFALMGFALVCLGAVLGGGYISSRFSTTEQDLQGRNEHWQAAWSIQQQLEGEWWGVGLGRFPANMNHFGPDMMKVGGFHVVDQQFMRLHTGHHVMGYGEMLRITQQVPAPSGPVRLQFRARSEKALPVQAEICEKRLLYHGHCQRGSVQVSASAGGWRNYLLNFETQTASFFAPGFRPLMFTLGVGARAQQLDLDDLVLLDSTGRTLLVNGDFNEGAQHWFFTSDRHHMPYHIKSMPFSVLYEQGILGLAVWSLILALVLWRAARGAASQLPLSPALCAALLGALAVGLFDTVIDNARIALMFDFLLLLGLGLSARAEEKAPKFVAARMM